jgi:diguanylate cyclase (GGDEF)-like protein/PAS domain S-box-containing protein
MARPPSQLPQSQRRAAPAAVPATLPELQARALVERLPAIVYVSEAGLDGPWHYVSAQVETILGFAPEEWLADPRLWAKRIHPDDRERVYARELELEEPGAPEEYRMLHRDGRTVWVRDHAALLANELGQLRWHGVLSDITDRKLAEAELQRRAAQQAAVAFLGRCALEGTDLNELMDEAVREATRILDVEVGAVLQLAPDGAPVVLRAGAMSPDLLECASACARKAAASPAESGGAGVPAPKRSRVRYSQHPSVHDLERRNVLSSVIEGQAGPWGLLCVQATTARDYPAADLDFLQALANVLADELQRRSAEEDIRYQALHDSLTGLPNRTLVLDHLEHARARPGKQVAVLLLDLDRFKLVNDSFGHAAGDALLIEIAPRLREALRPGDTIGRLGGDEFVVLLTEISDEQVVVEVAERIVAALRRPFLVEGIEHFVTVSIGIAVAAGERAALPGALIRDADAALYRAKDRGRARYEIFDRAMRVRAIERLSLENDLRRALDREQLRVHYQPVVSLHDRSILWIEALVHWEHPERGLVAPLEFIPVAEESGLIGPIGEWVMYEACRQASEWHAADPDAAPLGVSVNLSVRQITQRDLPGMVARTLRDTGLDPQCLCLEITETVILDDSEAANQALRALLSLGVGMVLDDFGTGYSSLAYLTRLPIRGLKIDRSFVERLGSSERSTAIVSAIIRMAEALSMEVTAEGVETTRQIEELQRLGCERAQGFYFARPLPAAELTEVLQRPGRRLTIGGPACDQRRRDLN